VSAPLHPFRFGVEMMEPFEGMTWADSARELEALGYATLFAPDHFDEGLGPITAMATAAAATTELTVAAAAEIAAALRLDPDDVLGSPFVLVGSVEEIVARLQERRDRWGYSYYTVQQPAAREFASVIAALT
jgi:alkanesulfonate monooxygenase SsuD/methylene tetrahydromethanopterin reductase-like flavin-dependent oxidoreductase (luciferase family)